MFGTIGTVCTSLRGRPRMRGDRFALSAFLLAAGLLALQSCLTGESSSGSGKGGPLARADKLFEAGKYAEAMEAYEAALAKDSTLSRAYQGYARAVVRFHGIDMASVAADFKSQDAPWPLLQHDDEILTNRLQGFSRANPFYRMLVDRDTLTRWWRYLDPAHALEAQADSFSEARKDFILNYLLQADLGAAGYRKQTDFPLSDLEVGAEAVHVDHFLGEFTYLITRLYDFDGNDTIDHRDSLMRRLIFDNAGNFDLDSLANGHDSAQAVNFDNIIHCLAQPENTCSLIDLISSDTTGSDSAIAELGDAVLFYQFGDGKDNDGDGCIDEEILDEKDNDGDGFVDEDARTLYSPANLGARGHGSAGFGAEAGGAGDTVGTAVNAERPWLLRFVHDFELAHPGEDFIKIRRGDPDMDYRLRLQKDSLATKSPAELAGPLQAKLDSAIALVGGCWRNYP